MTDSVDYYSLEGGRKVAAEEADFRKEIRQGFIRKVYGIVALQLLLTTVVASLLLFVPGGIAWAKYSSGPVVALSSGEFFSFYVGIIFGPDMFPRALYALYSALALVLFSFYLVIDTQLIIRRGSVRLEEDDYIVAAVMIYLDVINIFISLLRLFGERSE
ncbi:hypothetical protein, conserved [Eimeria brunetti]|uniref:Uncharacterized protein n=1 Tax=Eimeria brunetti TaxID=51314 RepID=U6LQ66_9EIME|nr:hypothetical protein, conserved [Eimeria brunetti]